MNQKAVRIIAGAVILVCIFVTGVSAGIIFESIGNIRQKVEELRNYAGTADFMLHVRKDGEASETDMEELFEPFWESWDLLQIRPKGTLFIPMYEPLRGTDHYEPAGDHETVAENGICLRITGDSRYKIAYRSAVLTGRFGYMADSDTDSSVLIIICYPNDPSAMYSEEPPLIEGDTGYSIHVYNDDGKSGGFAMINSFNHLLRLILKRLIFCTPFSGE